MAYPLFFHLLLCKQGNFLNLQCSHHVLHGFSLFLNLFHSYRIFKTNPARPSDSEEIEIRKINY